METGSTLEDFNYYLCDLYVIYDQITRYAVPSIWLFSLSSLCINIPLFIWKKKNSFLGQAKKLPPVVYFILQKWPQQYLWSYKLFWNFTISSSGQDFVTMSLNRM